MVARSGSGSWLRACGRGRCVRVRITAECRVVGPPFCPVLRDSSVPCRSSGGPVGEGAGGGGGRKPPLLHGGVIPPVLELCHHAGGFPLLLPAFQRAAGRWECWVVLLPTSAGILKSCDVGCRYGCPLPISHSSPPPRISSCGSTAGVASTGWVWWFVCARLCCGSGLVEASTLFPFWTPASLVAAR
jgi:hypothetical protein